MECPFKIGDRIRLIEWDDYLGIPDDDWKEYSFIVLELDIGDGDGVVRVENDRYGTTQYVCFWYLYTLVEPVDIKKAVIKRIQDISARRKKLGYQYLAVTNLKNL